MVDWARAAMERLVRAEADVRSAELQLKGEDPGAEDHYRSALRELDRARRFLNRVGSENEAVEEGGGLFG